jgi:predicted unusual protein kinase regulating ubiquinone biosynthesis (AarF/ABC1/UbiB family)
MTASGRRPVPSAHGARARYRRILRFALRFMLGEWWFELVLPRIGLRALSERGRNERLRRFAQRFHTLALELGGLMIKVGQFMSARLDVLPPEITEELEGLQDEVPAVPFAEIRAVIEAEFAAPLDRVYVEFQPEPVAAASLGQAHRARLSPALAADAGFAEVVVKVQRPGIDTIVEVDLAALRRVAGWLDRIRFVADRVDASAITEEFAATSLMEIDYLHEAGSAERFADGFADGFADDARVAVPAVGWERTTRRVLTLADVTAIKINDLAGLRAAGIDPAAVADELARVTFEQLFVHGFFHADPHPGNIFVTPLGGAGGGESSGPDWTLTFVDFGMMGEIPDDLRAGLREVLVAIVARDGARLVEGVQRVGILLPSADTAELERVMHELFDRFGGMAVADLQNVDRRELTDFAERLGDTLRTMPVQLPENFLLVVRAISLVSGVCTALNPRFNMWEAIDPYADRFMREEATRTLRGLGAQLASTAATVARLPGRIDDVIGRIERGDLEVKAPETEQLLRRLRRTLERVVSAIVFAALLVGGVIIRPGATVFGTVLMAVSAVPLLHALFAGLWGRRK